MEVNTSRFLFGEAEDFGPVAAARPGTHAALEADGGYSLGPGAFGVGNSLIARASLEAGIGDFRFRRALGLVSFRSVLGPFTLAARADGGRVWGAAPPQKLFRFGSLEGLRGYDPNEFGGSTAVLARGRLLLGLPPRSSEPLARVGFLLLPPLRPSLVLVGESGPGRRGRRSAGRAPSSGRRSHRRLAERRGAGDQLSRGRLHHRVPRAGGRGAPPGGTAAGTSD